MQLGLALLLMELGGGVTGVRFCRDGTPQTKIRPCPEDQGWKMVTAEPRSFLGWIVLGWILGFFLLTATVTLLCVLWVICRYLVSLCALRPALIPPL